MTLPGKEPAAETSGAAPIGFVGLGVMGAAMCANLARRSQRMVHAFDLRPEAFAAVSALGVRPSSSTAALAAETEIVFLCLQSTEAVQQVCSELMDGANRLQLVVDCSTTSVRATRSLATAFASRNIGYADAPIARMREAARDGTLCFMVGATEETFHTLEPLLKCMGSDILHCGPPGSGQVAKIMNNMVLINTVHALALALEIGRRNGVAGEILFDALAKGSADSPALRRQGMRHLLTGDFPANTFSTAYARKDIGLAEELAMDAALDDSLVRATAAVLERAQAGGAADAYYPILLNFLSELDVPID